MPIRTLLNRKFFHKMNRSISKRGCSLANSINFHLGKDPALNFSEDAYSHISNGKEILQAAKEHFNCALTTKSCQLPTSSVRWETLMQRCAEQINRFASLKEAIFFAQNSMPFDHRVAVKKQYGALPMFYQLPIYEALLDGEFTERIELMQKLQESPFSNPDTVYHHYKFRPKRAVSNVHYFHMNYFLSCTQFIKKTERILEIGTGYGNLCRLFLSQDEHPVKNYCLVDVPQSLFFAELFLRANFPEINIHYFEGQTELDLNEPSILLVPVQQTENFKKLGIKFDLGINTGSMAELSSDWVDYWMNWLDDISCRYFYSLNYCGNPLTNWSEGANTMAPRFSKRWQYRLLRPAPSVIALQAGSDRYFCEMIAEKMDVDFELSEERLENRYKENQLQFFSMQNYYNALDIAR
ncbi:MAG: putative sugar O-methyltransferase, partial [Chlamydiae bacterium]|nr:putative sugar O-methyltransferase [Chlamydiota bacterium]